MDIRTALKEGIARLRAAHVPSDTLAAEILLLHAIGRDRTWVYAHPKHALSNPEQETYLRLLEKRVAGNPTQYLTGKQEFWGLEFEVNPSVLIPRPETEHVVEVALDRLTLRELQAGRAQKNDGKGLQIADIGTGSGCIAIALGKELREAAIWAADVSREAIEVARRNARRLGFAERIEFTESNFFSACTGKTPFDLVVSNPPYVSRRTAETLSREVREHEPEIALYGGEQGYEFYAELVPEAARHLMAGGLLVMELGYDSLAAVRPLLESAEWANVGVMDDLAGIPRVIAAERTLK